MFKDGGHMENGRTIMNPTIEQKIKGTNQKYLGNLLGKELPEKLNHQLEDM